MGQFKNYTTDFNEMMLQLDKLLDLGINNNVMFLFNEESDSSDDLTSIMLLLSEKFSISLVHPTNEHIGNNEVIMMVKHRGVDAYLCDKLQYMGLDFINDDIMCDKVHNEDMGVAVYLDRNLDLDLDFINDNNPPADAVYKFVKVKLDRAPITIMAVVSTLRLREGGI